MNAHFDRDIAVYGRRIEYRGWQELGSMLEVLKERTAALDQLLGNVR